MSIIHATPTLLQAYANGYGTIALKKQEEASLQGCNRILIALAQSGQSCVLLRILSRLGEALKNPSSRLQLSPRVSTYLRCGTWLLPILIGYLDYRGENQEIPHHLSQTSQGLKRNIRWVHIHLGSIYFTSCVIANLALLYLGQTLYAATTLTVFAFHYLEQRRYLSATISRIQAVINPWIGSFACLLSPFWTYRLIGLSFLMDNVHDLFRSFKKLTPYAATTHPSLLDYSYFQKILQGQVQPTVDRNHIWIDPFPSVNLATIDPTTLHRFCNTFPWESPLVQASLDEALEKDARWSRACQNDPSLDTPAGKISYAKEQFRLMVDGVWEQKISTGQPLDYRVLKTYLGWITKQLPLAPQDVQRQLLIALAIEGGNYCGPGIYRTLETTAFSLLMVSGAEAAPVLQQISPPSPLRDAPPPHRLPLKQRILLILQQERYRIMEGFHTLVTQKNPYLQMIQGGESDIHAMNTTINYLGDDFGLPDQGAGQDLLAKFYFFEKLSFRYTFKLSPKDLWERKAYRIDRFPEVTYMSIEGYTVKRIVSYIESHIGTPLLPASEIREWAADWIRKTATTELNKANFMDTLGAGSVFERHLRFTTPFIQAMLVDMGILKVKS